MWLLIAAAYVGCGAALYWLAEDEKNDGVAATFWLIKLPKNVTGQTIVDLLTDHFENFKGLCNIAEISNASDGNALVELTIVYPIKKWPNKEVMDFKGLLAKSTDLISDKVHGAKVLHRFYSPEIFEQFDKLKK